MSERKILIKLIDDYHELELHKYKTECYYEKFSMLKNKSHYSNLVRVLDHYYDDKIRKYQTKCNKEKIKILNKYDSEFYEDGSKREPSCYHCGRKLINNKDHDGGTDNNFYWLCDDNEWVMNHYEK